MRRIAVVLVLVLVAAVWPIAGLGNGAQAAPAVTTASLQADFNNDGADDLAVGVPTEGVGSINRGWRRERAVWRGQRPHRHRQPAVHPGHSRGLAAAPRPGDDCSASRWPPETSTTTASPTSPSAP